MGKIGNHKAVLVCFLALNPHTVPTDAVGVEHRACVDTHVHLIVLEFDQTLGCCCALVDIVHEAVYLVSVAGIT